jgi:hypothetical protein
MHADVRSRQIGTKERHITDRVALIESNGLAEDEFLFEVISKLTGDQPARIVAP